MAEILKKLSVVQNTLKAPKGQYNSFGDFNYRSAEDILEAVKPLLAENGLTLILADDIVNFGDRYYVKATAKLFLIDGGEESVQTTAFAREDDSKGKMDGSQITGSASSYARKYALNGLFNIDDNKDADTNAYRQQQNNYAAEEAKTKKKMETETVTKVQAITMEGLANSYGANIPELLKFFKINSFAEMTKAQYADCEKMLRKKYGKKGSIGNGN